MNISIGPLYTTLEIETCLDCVKESGDPTLRELIALENLYDYIDTPFEYKKKHVVFSDGLNDKIAKRLRETIEFFMDKYINKSNQLSYIFDMYFLNNTSQSDLKHIWPTPSVLWNNHYPGLLEYVVNWIETYITTDLLTMSTLDLSTRLIDFDQYYLYLLFGLTRQSIGRVLPVVVHGEALESQIIPTNLPLPDLNFLRKKRSTPMNSINVLNIPLRDTETIPRNMQILTFVLNTKEEQTFKQSILLYSRYPTTNTTYLNQHIKDADVSRSLDQNKLVYKFPVYKTEAKTNIYKPLELFRYELPIDLL